MNTEQRRKAIQNILNETSTAITGTELARRLGVSRQVIVQDMAVLRAAGQQIMASPQGYYLYRPIENAQRAIIAVRHMPEQTEDELLAIVDCGVEIIDVIIEHEIYGEQRGMLHIASRYDVHRFIEQWNTTGARLLSELTDGLHLHTLEARRLDQLDHARQVLRGRGYLVE